VDSTKKSPYVFISYAHADGTVVIPGVMAMKNSNIELWYDEGIEAGSEWPEFIAQKVVACDKFVLFVSRAYLESQNCKRELNFAISRKKDILSIFIEDVELSPGMEMQLGTYQAIYRNRFADDLSFYDSLCREHFFDFCRKSSAKEESKGGASTNNTVNGNGSANNYNTANNNGGTNNYNTANGNGGTNTTYNTAFGKMTVNNGRGSNEFNNNFSNFFGGGSGAKISSDGSYSYVPKAAPVLPKKNKGLAIILAFFLSFFGIHKFYLGKPLQGVLCIVFCWTYVPFFISIIDMLVLFFAKEPKLREMYGCRFDNK